MWVCLLYVVPVPQTQLLSFLDQTLHMHLTPIGVEGFPIRYAIWILQLETRTLRSSSISQNRVLHFLALPILSHDSNVQRSTLLSGTSTRRSDRIWSVPQHNAPQGSHIYLIAQKGHHPSR